MKRLNQKMYRVPRINDQSKTCVTCAWFQLNPERKPHPLNRECCFKGKIRTEGGKCVEWKDPRTAKEKLLGKRIRVKAFTV
jgi:hypothetical protein